MVDNNYMIKLLKPIAHCYGVINAINLAKKVANDYEDKNVKLYAKVNSNKQEKIVLENRGKEQIKNIKRLQELEIEFILKKNHKDKLIKDLKNINDKNKKIDGNIN